MRTSSQRARPKYLDLRRIKLPLTGIVSIVHRITGVLLVFSIPLWLYLLELSLGSAQDFQLAANILAGFFVTLLSIVCLWALVHHFFAGIRFLLFDIDIAVEKNAALNMAKFVFIAEIVVMLPIIGWLL